MESWFLAGSHAQDFEAGLDPTTPYQGKNSGYIKSIVEELKGFGTLMQMFKADAYRNKRMRFAAVVKSERVAIWTGLWMRIDRPEDGKALVRRHAQSANTGDNRLAKVRGGPGCPPGKRLCGLWDLASWIRTGLAE